jgi:hypothetical protein
MHIMNSNKKQGTSMWRGNLGEERWMAVVVFQQLHMHAELVE